MAKLDKGHTVTVVMLVIWVCRLLFIPLHNPNKMF